MGVGTFLYIVRILLVRYFPTLYTSFSLGLYFRLPSLPSLDAIQYLPLPRQNARSFATLFPPNPRGSGSYHTPFHFLAALLLDDGDAHRSTWVDPLCRSRVTHHPSLSAHTISRQYLCSLQRSRPPLVYLAGDSSFSTLPLRLEL